jgi:hypothetical protein
LAQARRRLRLKEVVQPLILKARTTQCEQCLSRKQLQVECETPLEEIAKRFEEEFPEQKNAAELDQVAWKSFWLKYQRYHTICMACMSKTKEAERKQVLHALKQ